MFNKNYSLFRGKTTADNVWVSGDLIINGDKCYIHLQNSDFKVDNGETKDLRLYEVQPKTVGQYVGTVDKNGNKVFVGDILRRCFDKATFVVERLDTRFNMSSAELRESFAVECLDPAAEIIGNVYENAEETLSAEEIFAQDIRKCYLQDIYDKYELAAKLIEMGYRKEKKDDR